jgi:hypothetical protein
METIENIYMNSRGRSLPEDLLFIFKDHGTVCAP